MLLLSLALRAASGGGAGAEWRDREVQRALAERIISAELGARAELRRETEPSDRPLPAEPSPSPAPTPASAETAPPESPPPPEPPVPENVPETERETLCEEGEESAEPPGEGELVWYETGDGSLYTRWEGRCFVAIPCAAVGVPPEKILERRCIEGTEYAVLEAE